MDKDSSYFGFKKVSSLVKSQLVNKVFNDVAGKYDLMNDLMSFGIHRIWKQKLIEMIPDKASTILDMASGTGDISINYFKKRPNSKAKLILCDANFKMLENAHRRMIDNNILNNTDIILGDATNLPFADNKFDCYIVAFGIRNVNNIPSALKEAKRVLKKGGKFLCLELSPIKESLWSQLYDFYSFKVVPSIGECVTKKKDAYQYLVESVRTFPNKEKFDKMIKSSGFKKTGFQSMTCGVAAIHYGYK